MKPYTKPLVVKLPAHRAAAGLTANSLAEWRRRNFSRACLQIRHDPQTLRWTVVLCSRTTKEDVIVAWKQTEEDAAAWAQNYGARS